MKTQREYYVRFGETLSLDAKKKKLNKLSWVLLLAVVVDENHCPWSACEGLFVQEDIAGYAFLMRFLTTVETHRTPPMIKAIWSNGILQQSFLPQAGLLCDSTVLLLDAWHLVNKIWPEYFGATFFKQHLLGPMGRMCNAASEASFESTFNEVQRILLTDPAKLVYVVGYADQHNQYAMYCLQWIPGTLGCQGSADQNRLIQPSMHILVITYYSLNKKSKPCCITRRMSLQSRCTVVTSTVPTPKFWQQASLMTIQISLQL